MNFAVTAIMIAGAFGIVRSRFGRAFVAVRDDDLRPGSWGSMSRPPGECLSHRSVLCRVGGALWA